MAQSTFSYFFFNTSFQERTISDLHHNLYSSSLWPKLYKCVHLMYYFVSLQFSASSYNLLTATHEVSE